MKINICLNDGLPNISFNISGIDEERFCKFIDECNQAWRENEIIKKQLDRLHDQIMNLTCPEPSILLTDEHLLLFKTGHKSARHQAAALVAEAQSELLPDPDLMRKIKEIGGHGYKEIDRTLVHINDGKEDWGDPSNNCPACNGSGHKDDLREGCVLVARSAIVSVLSDAEHLAKTGEGLKDAINDLWKAEQSDDADNLTGLNDTVSDYWHGLHSAAYDLRKHINNLRAFIEKNADQETESC